jgi:N-acetylmuramoyl-L-alanine amidase
VSVIIFVAQTPSNGSAVTRSAVSGGNNANSIASPLDELSSADIAVHVAKLANLEETRSVANNADTVNAQLAITPADDKVIAKPQVVATAQKSRRDIKQYVVQPGETVASIAAKFGITSDSIRWSNGMTGDAVAAGKELTIPPITGIVYVVKAGDTPEKLAERYRVNKDAIISFNDAEVAGLPVGQKIVIPDATPPVSRATNTGIFSGGGFAWGGFAPVYGGGYDYGYCTYWSWLRRGQVGKPIPGNLGNASTWKVLAQRAGYLVDNVPRTHDVIWTPPRDYYGHVGFVEEVYPDGSIKVSEMNTAGWNRVSYKVLSAEQAAAYSYIH